MVNCSHFNILLIHLNNQIIFHFWHCQAQGLLSHKSKRFQRCKSRENRILYKSCFTINEWPLTWSAIRTSCVFSWQKSYYIDQWTNHDIYHRECCYGLMGMKMQSSGRIRSWKLTSSEAHLRSQTRKKFKMNEWVGWIRIIAGDG